MALPCHTRVDRAVDCDARPSQRALRDYVPRQRGYSSHSCEAYAYSFRLLFTFVAKQNRHDRRCRREGSPIEAAGQADGATDQV